MNQPSHDQKKGGHGTAPGKRAEGVAWARAWRRRTRAYFDGLPWAEHPLLGQVNLDA